MNKNIERSIIKEKKHQFLYGYNSEDRYNFLKDIESRNPISNNSDKPGVIYIDDGKLAVFSKEYLNFSILLEVLTKMKKDVGLNILMPRLRRLIDLASSRNMYVKSIADLEEFFKEAKAVYKDLYLEFTKTGEVSSTNYMKLSFSNLNDTIYYYKRALNNNSNFIIILDNKNNISSYSIKAVNSLIQGSKDISIKVATDIENWPFDTTLNGTFIEYDENFNYVELDDSYKKHIERVRKKYIGGNNDSESFE